jgi:membrane-bound serine protease (ClpP class)
MKYTLLQIPGWLIFALLLVAVNYWLAVPLWLMIVLWVLWVVKDFLLYPLVRSAYEAEVRTGSEQLIGEHGIVCERLTPKGYVFVRGELWRAVPASHEQPLEPGTRIRVTAADGLTLTVTADVTEKAAMHTEPSGRSSVTNTPLQS